MSDQPDVPLSDEDDTSEHTPTSPRTPVNPMPQVTPPAPTTGTRRRGASQAEPGTPPAAYPAYNPPQASPTRTDRRTTAPIPQNVAPLVTPPNAYYPPEPPYVPPPPNVRRGAARSRRDSGLYLPWWSLVIMLALVGGLAFGALLVVNTLGGQTVPGGATPIVIVITATYTVGPPASQTSIPQQATLTPTAPLPTIPPSVTLPPGNFVIGATVQVIGVSESGLNVRSSPGTGFTVKFRAKDGDKFLLKEGPQQASGEEWWHILDPANPNNDGWAARRYLTVVSQ